MTIDTTKIMNELGLKPSIKLEEGIKETIDLYMQNQNWLKKNVVSDDY